MCLVQLQSLTAVRIGTCQSARCAVVQPPSRPSRCLSLFAVAGLCRRSGFTGENIHAGTAASASTLPWHRRATAPRKISRVELVRGATTVVANSASGWLDLRDIFPMLNSVSHLPTAVFKNLNIQIEYSTLLDRQLLVDTTAHITSKRPILAVDVLQNPKIVAKLNGQLKSARWLELEHDQFNIPVSANDGGANDQNLLQSVNPKINAFNNKHVERILITKEYQKSIESRFRW